MAVALHEPFVVVALDERPDLALGMREILEAMQPQALLLQRPHEALDHSVALRLPDERGRALHPQPPQLRAERMGGVLRAPVTTNREPPGDVLAEPAERVADPLVDRLQGRPPITPWTNSWGGRRRSGGLEPSRYRSKREPAGEAVPS